MVCLRRLYVTFAAQVFASNRSNRLCATAGKAQLDQHRLHAAAATTSQILRAFDGQKSTTILSPSPSTSQ